VIGANGFLQVFDRGPERLPRFVALGLRLKGAPRRIRLVEPTPERTEGNAATATKLACLGRVGRLTVGARSAKATAQRQRGARGFEVWGASK